MKHLVLVSLLLLTASSAWAQQPNPLCGDCNQDSSVTVDDALVALQAASMLITLSPTAQDLCDVNSDTTITSLDALEIAQFSADVRPTLTCPGIISAGASEPIPVLEPATGLGNCVQGQSLGNDWTFDILGGGSFYAPALSRGATAVTLATQWTSVINAPQPPGSPPAPFTAFRFGHCVFVRNNGTGGQATLQINEGGTTCIPDLGTPCVFGGN